MKFADCCMILLGEMRYIDIKHQTEYLHLKRALIIFHGECPNFCCQNLPHEACLYIPYSASNILFNTSETSTLVNEQCQDRVGYRKAIICNIVVIVFSGMLLA